MTKELQKESEGRPERPLSPCVLICTLDDARRCLGCGRTVEQISRWALMTPAEQWAVVEELAAQSVND
jgi:predicted Fe-S protein YdhL (DUF1289 family)